MTPEKIKSYIVENLDCKFISVEGDGVHFEALIVSDKFSGVNRVNRHQLIYQILGDKMKSEIHALSIKAFTSKEWAEKLSGKV
ncbi:MAG: BolA family transcriptional regulator [Betaproteobacteria bacterium TMED41]|nr:MAG: BolA family transcriptional regulator [Betaproteobacteria bacterium TMED41]|tara:strand:+ start:4025 stop:4273 length:249 start_codon:yes stop_codon:yes gene_type:complete